MHAAMLPQRLCLSKFRAVARCAAPGTLLDALTAPLRPFTASRCAPVGRSVMADVRTQARGGKALQELLDGREEDREDDDDTPIGRLRRKVYNGSVEAFGVALLGISKHACLPPLPLSLPALAPQSHTAVTQLQWESPLQVVKYPDPRLRAVNARVGFFDDSLRALAEAMFVVMYE